MTPRGLIAAVTLTWLLIGPPSSAVSAASADPALVPLEQAMANVQRVWSETPLKLRSLQLVKQGSQGFGMYERRSDNVFKPGEKILTYAEPVGFGWRDIGRGAFEIGFGIDLRVLDATGTEVASQKDFATLKRETHARNMEFSVDLSLSLDGAPPGTYTIEYTLRDLGSPKVLAFRQDVVIAAGT